jgi:hypothetical protein
MHMSEHSPWRGFNKAEEQKVSSAPEFGVYGYRHAVERYPEVPPVMRKKNAATLPSRRSARGSPSLLISSSDQFITSPIDSGMI